MRQYLRNAIQYDARRGRPAGLLTLGDAAADVARRLRAGPAAPVRRLARLLFRQADRLAQRAGRWSTARLQAPHGYRAHRAPAGHEVLVDDGPAAGQASPPLARNQTWPVPSSSASHCPAPGHRAEVAPCGRVACDRLRRTSTRRPLARDSAPARKPGRTSNTAEAGRLGQAPGRTNHCGILAAVADSSWTIRAARSDDGDPFRHASPLVPRHRRWELHYLLMTIP